MVCIEYHTCDVRHLTRMMFELCCVTCDTCVNQSTEDGYLMGAETVMQGGAFRRVTCNADHHHSDDDDEIGRDVVDDDRECNASICINMLTHNHYIHVSWLHSSRCACLRLAMGMAAAMKVSLLGVQCLLFGVLGFLFGLFACDFDALQHLHGSGVAVVAMRMAEILVS